MAVSEMQDHDYNLNKEPLWSIPQPVQERVQLGLDRSDYRNFLLSGFYCAMNAFLLVLFGAYSATSGEIQHATVLFSLAGIIVAGYGLIWSGGWYALAKHFITAMMAVLCLYLFYTGGIQNTGPLYYFVFPSVALFLHGRLRGFLWVILLLFLTIMFWKGAFGFNVDRYENIFISRLVVICLIVALLSCIPEHFRMQAERNLMLSYTDMEALSYGDPRTRLANRALLEKIVQMESNRNQRYGSACCLMFIEPDPLSSTLSGRKLDMDNERLLQVIADVLRKSLRVQDIGGCWENNCFLLVLPEVSLEGAGMLAARLLDAVSAKRMAFGNLPVTITASIGIAALDKGPPQNVLERAANALIAAQRKHGNCWVADGWPLPAQHG